MCNNIISVTIGELNGSQTYTLECILILQQYMCGKVQTIQYSKGRHNIISIIQLYLHEGQVPQLVLYIRDQCLTLLCPEMCLFNNYSSYNACIVEFPLSSFVSHFFTTTIGVELWVAHCGFYSITRIVCNFCNEWIHCRGTFRAILQNVLSRLYLG